MAKVTYPALDLRFAAGPGAGTFQDMLYAELDSFEPVAIQEHETGDGWRVFFRTAALRDAARGALASEFGNALLDLTPEEVDDEDWARRSQAALKAVRVGRIVVAPPWEVTDTRGSRLAIRDSITIIIDPSMGFGTGHHATTRLCLELLQQMDVRGRRVIDVGTGSGVLALAAWMLGAAEVSALDNDPDALRNASDNAARNGAEAAIEFVESDVASAALPPAHIVLANLTSAVIQRHAAALRRLGIDGAVFVLSGFSPEESADIARALGLPAREVVRDGEWAALSLGGA